MKKRLLLLAIMFLIPILNVNALKCYDKEIDVSKIENFSCSEVEGDSLTFKDNTDGTDYSKFFTYTISDKKGNITINKDIKFDSSYENRYIKVSDSSSDTVINIKNEAYVKPTTTTTTTTTKNQNIKEVIVTFDDGENKSNKTYGIPEGSSYVSVTLPKVDKTDFNGWGTASGCKEGNVGSVRVEKDITYYACYKSNSTTSKDLTLSSLEITDKDTGKKIKFGTFSIKKTTYEFKVLNEVKNLDIKATSTEGVEVEITGNTDLKEGKNEVIIKLRNNNVINEYKLIVTRLKAGETIENIHYLKSLVVGGYTINFKKETFTYSLTIPSDINNLEITAIPLESTDTVDIVGKDNLSNGSVIKINVTDGNGEVTTYSINITKEKNTNIILFVAVGVIILLIIILIILIIIKSNKKKKNNTSGPKTLNTANNNKQDIEVLNI